MKRVNLNSVIGIFLLLFGVLLGLDRLNLGVSVDYSVTFWSFLALLGIFMMFNDRKVSILSSILLFVGLWNVLSELDVITGSIFTLFWPIIFVIVGVNLIFGKKFISITPANLNNPNALVYNGVFSGVEERLSLKDFKGLTANAIFGGVDLDLRDVEIKDNVQIDLSALFGGISIRLPDIYNVELISPLSLFGGTENNFKGQHDEAKKTIYINSRAIFGGIEIK